MAKNLPPNTGVFRVALFIEIQKPTLVAMVTKFFWRF